MFLAPLFLIGLLAAAIPLLLHLRRSTRIKRLVFPSSRFFDEAFVRAARRARLQDRLLMALRMALFALLALALAQPLIRLPGFLGMGVGGGAGRSVAIVLDDSASMALADQRGPLLERAKEAALRVLDDLSPAQGDRATVVLAGLRGGQAKALFDQPTNDLDAVRKAIEQVEPADLATDLQGAIDAAVSQLGAGSDATGEILVLSDLQATGFAGQASLAAPPGVGLMLVSVRPDAAGSADNLAVDAVQVGSAQPLIGVPFTLRALVSNHGPAPCWANVELVMSDAPLTRRLVALAPGQSQVVRFVHRFDQPGWYAGRITLTPASEDGSAQGTDAIAVDNQRHFALNVEDNLRVLAVNGAPSQIAANDELFFFRLALGVGLQTAGRGGTADAGPRLDQITPEQITPERLGKYPMVLMANVAELPPTGIEALERYVDAGGSLLITLGDRVRPEAYNQWLGEHRLHGGLLPGPLRGLVGQAEPTAGPGETGPAMGDAGFVAQIADGHAALAGFTRGELGALTTVRFSARYSVGVEGDGEGVLMRTAAGEPVLMERRFGRGRVMLWASSIDRGWTNFPLQPTFVPWVYRLVGNLCQPNLARRNFARTGDTLILPTSTTAEQAVYVQGPDGQRWYPPLRPDDKGSPSLVFDQTEQAGIYAVHEMTSGEADAAKAGEPRLLFAANLPDEEADTTYLTEADIQTLAAPDLAWVYIDTPEAVLDASDAARHGIGLWNQLLWLALLVGLFEPWLANRLSRRRAQESPDALRQRGPAGRTRRMAKATEEEREPANAA